jgi:hypothetical protein
MSKPRDVIFRAERPVKCQFIKNHAFLLTLSDQRITEGRLRVPGLHCGRLDKRVRVFPGKPARHQWASDQIRPISGSVYLSIMVQR